MPRWTGTGLPVGIQTLRRIREEAYYYVDKTAYASRIARSAGAHYFSTA